MENAQIANKRRWIIPDVMKAICICMVIITHVGGMSTKIRKRILWPFTILPAVPLFLMMSVFVFSLAEDKKNGTVRSWFEWQTFWKRLNRFLIPQAVAIAVIIAGLFAFTDMKRISAEAIFEMFQRGGRGPGAYYVILMYQLLIAFPFIRMFFRKNQIATVTGMVLLYIAYETLCGSWKMNGRLYNTLIFRFLPHIALGLLLYEYWRSLRNTALPAICIAVGTIYLINLYYLGYKPVMTYKIESRDMVASLYSFGILCYALRAEDVLTRISEWGGVRRILSAVCYIGKASYHIMLAQMVFFYFARMFEIEARIGSLWRVVLFDLAVSLTSGCLFYALDQWIRRRIKRVPT